MDLLSTQHSGHQNSHEIFESSIAASLQSVYADILEFKAACTMDIAVGSDLEIRLVELVHRYTDLLRESRKEVDDLNLAANNLHDLYEQADSTIILLQEENNWLRSQADEAIIKSELLQCTPLRCQDQIQGSRPSFWDEFKFAEV